jgi:hypothetical protein
MVAIARTWHASLDMDSLTTCAIGMRQLNWKIRPQWHRIDGTDSPMPMAGMKMKAASGY